MKNSDLLREAYDPAAFRRLGHEVIDLLADHLEQLAHKPANQLKPPQEMYDFWSATLENTSGNALTDWLPQLLQYSVQVPHPRYMGHQISPPVPMSALAGLVDGLLNNGMGVYEMGASSTAMERAVIRVVADQMELGQAADGFLTSGGTLANLTALLAARSRHTEVWNKGNKQQLALMVSEEAHYCVSRAVRIMGWGAAGLILVPADHQRRMRADALEAELFRAESEGKKVIAVIGSACSTSTGAFDPLSDIADFCTRHQLWFHVDGAHGGALCFSRKHRHLLEGIARADSVVMDFHKMLLQPAITTALVFKDGQQSFRTFQQKAHYLWSEQQEPEWHNLAKRTFECTKLMMSVRIYSVLRAYGTSLWERYVDQVIECGQELARQVQARADFELAVPPSCNIVCFRYTKMGLRPEQLNALNTGLRQQIIEDGRFYIVQTSLDGQVYLRCTLASPFTTSEDIRALLDFITKLAAE